MRGIRWIPAAAMVAAVSVVLLAGCSGDEVARAGSPTAPAYLQVTPGRDDPSPSPAPSPASSAEAAPSPEPASAAPSGPVEVESPLQIQPVQGTPGEPYDPRQVYDAVVLELNKLLVNPDPDQLELTVSRECDCYQEWQERFAELASLGQRYERVVPPSLLYFEVIVQRPEMFEIDIVDAADQPNRLLDARTFEVLEVPAPAPPFAKRLLLQQTDGVWRIRQLANLVGPDGENLGLGRIPQS